MIYPPLFIEYCTSLSLKLTSLRKAILYILWSSTGPLKAYQILDNLLKIKPNAKPPTVYRALLFFISGGLVHKVESIQSYALCCEPAKRLQLDLLMVCNHCHQVIEVYDSTVGELVTLIAQKNAFKLSQGTIELNGVCQGCESVELSLKMH